MKPLQQREIGNIAVKDYKHKIPNSFFCVQCGKTHYRGEIEFKHYYNALCHKWAYAH